MRVHSRIVRYLCSALTLGALCVVHEVSASRTRIDLGEVSLPSEVSSDVGLSVFRQALHTELDKLDASLPAKKAERFVLSARLVRLATRKHQDQLETTCVVSATLRDAKSGALFAILRGRGLVQDEATERKPSRLLALNVAVRGALRQLPQALNR